MFVIAWPARYRCSTPVSCSTSRRMSFIGSTERTRGMASKLFSGGGEGVYHSSVLAFHGSGRAGLDRADEVDDRGQDAEREDPGPDRGDEVVDVQPVPVGVLVHAPRHAG